MSEPVETTRDKYSSFRLDLLPILVILALVVAFFWRTLFGGMVLLPIDALFAFPPWKPFAQQLGIQMPHNELISDMILQNYSWKSFAKQSLLNGDLPLWNPYVLAGMPFMAAGQYAVLYPLGAIFYVLPVAQAYGWFTALHLFLAGLFTYIYLRVIGANRLGSLISAVAFMFCSFLIVSFVWPMIVSTAIWLPLLLAMIELIIRKFESSPRPWRSSLVYILLGGVLVGTQFLAGHLEIGFYVLFTMLFYTCCRLLFFIARDRQPVPAIKAGLALGAMVFIGFALAAGQLIPFYELIKENYRSGMVTYDEVIGYALPKKQILGFVVPDVFGNPTHHEYLDVVDWATKPVDKARDFLGNPVTFPRWSVKNYVEAAGYVGILPLLLALTALALRRDRYTVTFSAYAFVSLLLAFGTPLYWLFWQIPGFDQLHSPFRWIYPFSLSVAVLAGLGMSHLTSGRSTRTLTSRATVGQPSGDVDLHHDPDAVQLSATLSSTQARSQLKLPVLEMKRHQSQDLRLQPDSLGLHMPAEAKLNDIGVRVSPALAIGLASVLIGILILAGLAFSRVFANQTLAFADSVLRRSQLLPYAFESGQMLYSYQSRNLLIFGLLLATGGSLIAYASRWRARMGEKPLPGLFSACAVGAVAVDLFLFGYDFNAVSDPSLLDFRPPSLAALRQDPDLFRITTFNYDDNLRPNSNMLAGLQDIRGYDTVIPRQYVEYWRLMEEPDTLPYSMLNKLVKASSLESPLLDLLNVKYVLTTQNIGLPSYTEVYRGEINIYRNDDYLPRAFLVGGVTYVGTMKEAYAALARPGFDPRREVIITTDNSPSSPSSSPYPPPSSLHPPPSVKSYDPNRVTISATAVAPSYLVLADSFFAGWRASVDGQEVPVLRANAIFRAVVLEPGEHEVVFWYSPDSVKLGFYISFIGVVGVLLGLGFAGWQRFYPQIETPSTIQRIVKNSVTPMAVQLVNKFVDFGYAILMVRFLGLENTGKYYVAVVLIGYFLIVTDFGLGTLLSREVAKAPATGNRYLGNTIGLRIALSLASLPVILGVIGLYSWQFGLTADTAITVMLFWAGIFPSGVNSALSSIFFAHERMEYPAAITIITNLLKVSLGITVLLLGWGIIGLGGVSLGVNLITMALLFHLVSSLLFRPGLHLDFPFQKAMLREAFPLMINNLLSTIFFRIDVMLLLPMLGDRAVGAYSTAYRFIDGLNFIPSFFTLAIFPVMSRYAASSRESLMRGFTLSLKLLLLIGIPITVGTALVADKIILLFFTEEFRPAILALQILIWFLPFSFINSVTQYVLIAVNQQRFLTIAFIIGATFNIAGNLIAIPRFGISGAAVVTILSEIVLMLPFFYAVDRHVGSVPLFSIAWRPALASFTMGIVAWLVRDLNLFLIVGIALPAYMIPLVLLRTFDSRDVEILRSLVRR